jgi:hypothetical protein
MTQNAVIQAVYCDYRRIKSRKVHQIVFEIDSALWPTAYKILGEPTIETSDWVAIAKMNGAAEPAPTPEKQGSNLAANAALMVKEPLFQRFLNCEHEETADASLKMRLGIKSKSELNTDAAAASRWRDLRAEFEAWKRT